MTPKSAMIFAAGFGTRMGALTSDIPKPLVPVLGQPMIDQTIRILNDAGITSVHGNTHFFADQLEAHLASFPNIIPVRETPDILETGGGLKNALPLIGAEPVLTSNCDAVWFGQNPASQLLHEWDAQKMDGLLLMLKPQNAHGHLGSGDFFLSPSNQLEPRGSRAKAPYIYSGIQIIKTDLLAEIKEPVFSISKLWEKLHIKGTLYGTVYYGDWVDVGHPDGIKIAQSMVPNA